MKPAVGSRPIDCHLVCSSSSQHLNQLYAGFGMLAKRGLIKVMATKANPFLLGPYVHPKLEVWVDGKLKLMYDAYDGADFLEEPLADCHLYFKRSFEARAVAAHAHGHKVRPLGLNYIVYGPRDFWFRRAMWSIPRKRPFRPAIRQFIQASGLLSKLFRASNGRNDCGVENFEGVPQVAEEPRVLLLTRTWDPAQVAGKPDRVEERQRLNQMRAECIQALRQAFGEQFTGGFEPSQHAREHFPDCVARDPRQTRKEAFIRLVHEADVCVTTLGLRESNGFRVAEYTAAARAIVMERMRHQVPGDFEAGQNYLDFTSPDECVAAVRSLLGDPAKRYAMMQRNHEYYRAYVRPDALVWNTLQTALTHFPNESAGLSSLRSPPKTITVNTRVAPPPLRVIGLPPFAPSLGVAAVMMIWAESTIRLPPPGGDKKGRAGHTLQVFGRWLWYQTVNYLKQN